ncbi:uncharacterized protein [Montipora capricornis]|uniref:uncharacterized protein n=1 Tax=Montipora capricornis TaxID=246305 RepID=UPI0035F12601
MIFRNSCSGSVCRPCCEVVVMKTFRLVLCFLVCCFAGVFSSATASQEVCTKGPFPYKEGDRKILDCDFTDAAIRDILWYKDNKLLVNGSGGLYQSLTRLNHDTLRSSFLFQFVRFKHAGFYTCKPEPSQPVSNCPDGKSVHILVECGNGYMKAYDALVSVKKFSNATLRCSAMAWLNCFLGADLTWYHGNKTLKNNTKYTIRKQNTNECNRVVEAEFFLDIWNVTNADVGEYVCQMKCFTRNKTKNDSVQLVHYFEEDDKGEDVLDNKLFISYSSKDFSWVTENLISLLEKHSIPYRIHIRDFELGRPIVQNMAESVYNSRQVLVVLSNNYLASNFCREELHMALQRGVDTGDSTLVLVKIDNKLKKKQLPLALRAKNLLDFEKYKEKQDWEKKILNIVSEQKSFSVHV